MAFARSAGPLRRGGWTIGSLAARAGRTRNGTSGCCATPAIIGGIPRKGGYGVDNLQPNQLAVISSCGQMVAVTVLGRGGFCPCCEQPAYRVRTEALQELDVCSTLLSRPH